MFRVIKNVKKTETEEHVHTLKNMCQKLMENWRLILCVLGIAQADLWSVHPYDFL